MGARGGMSGIARRNNKANAIRKTAAMRKTERQLSHSAIHPEKVRLSRMPSSRPVMTEPTARPALAGVAISGAMGSRTWVTAARAPVTSVMSTMGSNDGTTAVTSMATTRPGDHLEDEAAAFQNIAERYKEEQPDGVAGLRGDGDVAHLGLGDVEAACHVDEQRLVEIESGDGNARGQAEQRDEALARGRMLLWHPVLVVRGQRAFHSGSMLVGILRFRAEGGAVEPTW